MIIYKLWGCGKGRNEVEVVFYDAQGNEVGRTIVREDASDSLKGDWISPMQLFKLRTGKSLLWYI